MTEKGGLSRGVRGLTSGWRRLHRLRGSRAVTVSSTPILPALPLLFVPSPSLTKYKMQGCSQLVGSRWGWRCLPAPACRLAGLQRMQERLLTTMCHIYPQCRSSAFAGARPVAAFTSAQPSSRRARLEVRGSSARTVRGRCVAQVGSCSGRRCRRPWWTRGRGTRGRGT